ncbi:hypothetical protein DEJ48_38665 [Streptomyces venezuelae]|uniref:Uncharacterized protein n=1 Tax=Streptomyces venezuelae TaxID=54571 RepID=A0A5P2C786_STRVZ|nr:hypothetical protein [Streptomyces venezuelae]QES38554.1 hypothetical protein DEJ48_38665 [Streptomyces venezuelae]
MDMMEQQTSDVRLLLRDFVVHKRHWFTQLCISSDTDDYIPEAKWLKGAVEAGPLMLFNDKVRRKGKDALGRFISVNGFSSGARSAFNERTAFLTVDGRLQ